MKMFLSVVADCRPDLLPQNHNSCFSLEFIAKLKGGGGERKPYSFLLQLSSEQQLTVICLLYLDLTFPFDRLPTMTSS